MHFTREEQEMIRENLLQTGLTMSKSLGLQKMTVSKLTTACKIAKGSFYNFYESKEAFVISLIEYSRQKSAKMFMQKLDGREKMTVHDLFAFYREYITTDYDFMNKLTIDDYLWMRKHLASRDYFNPEKGFKLVQELLSMVEGVREDIDFGIVVNLIKSIYALKEHRATMVQSSLDDSIDLIFKLLERYVSGEDI